MLIIGCIFLILFICAVGYILNKHDVDIRIAALGVDYFQCVRLPLATSSPSAGGVVPMHVLRYRLRVT